MSTMNIFDMSDLWNDGATTFSAIRMNVTDTASASGSLLMDLQVGGASKFRIEKTGSIRGDNANGVHLSIAYNTLLRSDAGLVAGATGYGFGVTPTSGFGWNLGGFGSNATDLILYRDAANTLAQRNGVNAQEFRVYNTFTDASNYERGFMRWNTNVLEIGAEAAGTGTARNVSFKASEITVGTAIGSARINFANTAHYIRQSSGGIEVVGNSHLGVKVTAGRTDIYSDTVVISGALPTTNPAVAGQLWNDAGTLKIST